MLANDIKGVCRDLISPDHVFASMAGRRMRATPGSSSPMTGRLRLRDFIVRHCRTCWRKNLTCNP